MPFTYIDPNTKLRTALPLDQIDSNFKSFKEMVTHLVKELSFTKKPRASYDLGHLSIYCQFCKRAQWTVLDLKNKQTKKYVSYYCVTYLPLNKQIQIVTNGTSVKSVYLNDFINEFLTHIRDLWVGTNAN